MLKGHLKEVLPSLGDGAHLKGQTETRLTDKAEMKSSKGDDPSGPEMRSPGTDDHVVDNPEICGPDADTPGADN